MAGDGSLAADALSQVWQLPHHAQVVLRVYTKGCLSRDLGPDGCLRAITQVFRFPDTLSLWQYACVRTLVRWTAYRGTLLSVLEYAAQRTAVILPNVLLSFCPTYCCTPAQRTGIWMGHSVTDGYLFSDWIYGFSIITRLKRIRLLYSLLYNMYLLFLVLLRERVLW